MAGRKTGGVGAGSRSSGGASAGKLSRARGARDELVDALVRLYASVFAVPESDVRPAAAHRCLVVISSYLTHWLRGGLGWATTHAQRPALRTGKLFIVAGCRDSGGCRHGGQRAVKERSADSPTGPSPGNSRASRDM